MQQSCSLNVPLVTYANFMTPSLISQTLELAELVKRLKFLSVILSWSYQTFVYSNFFGKTCKGALMSFMILLDTSSKFMSSTFWTKTIYIYIYYFSRCGYALFVKPFCFCPGELGELGAQLFILPLNKKVNDNNHINSNILHSTLQLKVLRPLKPFMTTFHSLNPQKNTLPNLIPIY